MFPPLIKWLAPERKNVTITIAQFIMGRFSLFTGHIIYFTAFEGKYVLAVELGRDQERHIEDKG